MAARSSLTVGTDHPDRARSRRATYAVLVVCGLLFITAGAFVIAKIVIGPPLPLPATTLAGTSRPAADNWRTHSSLLEGIPVAIILGADFVRAWVGLIGLGWLTTGGLVAASLSIGTRLFRRALHHPGQRRASRIDRTAHPA